MESAEKIREWKGGRLRIFANELVEPFEGIPLAEVTLRRRALGEREAVPIGDGFAHFTGGPVEIVDLGVEVTFEVRDGLLECVAISSPPGGPGLTLLLIKELKIGELVNEQARVTIARLEVDKQGEVIGVLALSPPSPIEFLTRTVEDIDRELGAVVRRPGRPPLSATELERVAQVYREAKVSRQPMVLAVAEEFDITMDAAKKRIQKARRRGLLPPVKPKKTLEKEEPDG